MEKDPVNFFLFDVDGTLTDVRKNITKDVIDFIQKIRQKVYIGIVSGSELEAINQQLKGEGLQMFDYVFTENGLCYHKNGVQHKRTNFVKYMGEDKYQEFINFCLKYLSELKLPIKRAQFIELKTGLVNICPSGRTLSAEERDVFIAYDKEHRVREEFINALSNRFSDAGLVYTKGGQISFDVYPRGWNKRYCLDHIDADGFENIHFFGDKCEPGGTDHEIYKDPRVSGHKVTGPDDTKKQVREIFQKEYKDFPL